MNAAKNGLEISLTHSGSDTYVAVGITKSKAMENTDIYYCQNRGSFSKYLYVAIFLKNSARTIVGVRQPCAIGLYHMSHIESLEIKPSNVRLA